MSLAMPRHSTACYIFPSTPVYCISTSAMMAKAFPRAITAVSDCTPCTSAPASWEEAARSREAPPVVPPSRSDYLSQRQRSRAFLPLKTLHGRSTHVFMWMTYTQLTSRHEEEELW